MNFELAVMIISTASMTAIAAAVAVVMMLRRKKVKKHSSALASLYELNEIHRNNFNLSLESEFENYKEFSNKRSFDNARASVVLQEYVLENEEYFKYLIGEIDLNIRHYVLYSLKAEKIFDNRTTDWYGRFDYGKLERKIFQKNMLKVVLDINIAQVLEYISPKGKNHYSQEEIMHAEDVRKALENISKQREYKQQKEYQRNLMSPALRYDIMKRDGFRCVLCGARAAEGAKLHVDHIKPIAKGGKTEASNLRTLCDRCNLGKSDKYDQWGYN
jgi:hypothetical protein